MLELNKIHQGDALELLKSIPDESIDLVIIDPPYNLNYYSNHGSKEYRERIQDAQDWDNDFNFKPYLPELMRISKENSFILVFGCEENIPLMKKLGCFQILVWNKEHCGMGDLSDFGIGYEFIFYFKKGNPKLIGKRINGIISYKHIGFFSQTCHPTQKPVGLIKLLVEKCSKPESIVLDCFGGSGTTALACVQTNRKFILIEKEEKYCKIAEERLKKLNSQQLLTF